MLAATLSLPYKSLVDDLGMGNGAFPATLATAICEMTTSAEHTAVYERAIEELCALVTTVDDVVNILLLVRFVLSTSLGAPATPISMAYSTMSSDFAKLKHCFDAVKPKGIGSRIGSAKKRRPLATIASIARNTSPRPMGARFTSVPPPCAGS